MGADDRPGSVGTAPSSDGLPASLDEAVARDAVAASGGAERHGIEQHGIDLIPAQHRRGQPRDLLWLWMGVTLNIEFLLFGGLLPAVGLSFWQSVLAIAIGNLAWFITGVTSLQGPRTGTANLMITRAAFGTRGGRLIALFCWLSLVTYETIGLALIVLGSLALLDEMGVESSTALKIVLIPLAASVQLILPFFGHQWILRVVRWLVPPFIVLYILLTIQTAPKVDLAGDPAPFSVFLLGLAIVGATGGLAFVMLGSDYSRYLPAASSKRAIVWNVGIGGYVASTLIMILGAALGSIASGAFTADPVSNLNEVFDAWFVVPYLLVVIAQVYAINTVDLYSSALSLQALGLPFRRWQCVLVDTVLCSGLTALAIFSSSFNQFVVNASLFLMVWIAPWVGVYLTDWGLRRGEYDPPSLVAARGGTYWRSGGWHIPALCAQAVGMVVALLAINTSVYVGPLSDTLWGVDFSIPFGIVLASVVYWLTARSGVRREAAAPSGVLEADRVPQVTKV